MRGNRIRAILGGVALGVALFASLATSSEENTARPAGSDDEASTDDGQSDSGPPSTFAVGEPIALGEWEVVVHGVVDPVVPTNEFLTPDEGERWVSVDVEVTNNSDEPESVSSLLCFELQDDTNRSYDQTITGEDGASPPDGEVDPGGSRRGSITYEVPTDATGLVLRFKCELFSSGSAIIALG